MATVPGQPIDEGGIPKELQPGQMYLNMAAAILHQQGRMQLAGDVIPPERLKDLRIQQNIKAMTEQSIRADETRATLSRALGGTQNILPMTPKNGD